MRETQYYSLRMGINKSGVKIDHLMLKRLFFNIYNLFQKDGFFYESFGYECVDGYLKGILGPDIEAVIFHEIRKENLYPFEAGKQYSEDDLFDIIEFCYTHVSEPESSGAWFHNWNDCGYHYRSFNKESGQEKFRAKLNNILRNYQDGYELSKDGRILKLPDIGFENLLNAEIPSKCLTTHQKMEHAISKFRGYKSSLADRRDAIRELADVLENLRPAAKKILTEKDDADLFNLANNFEIRHHNQRQKIQYDKNIWYSWMFYFYLSTIHAILRFIEKDQTIN